MRFIKILIPLWISIAIPGCSEKLRFQDLPLGFKSDLKLMSDQGKEENPALALKQVNLLFFGYTHCPDFCPMTLQRIQSAVAGDAELQKKMALIFISVDPKQDKPADLARYLTPFPYARGYTGTPEQLQLAEKAFGAYAKEEPDKISHSLYLYLLNQQGKVIFLMRYDDPLKKIRQALKQAESTG